MVSDNQVSWMIIDLRKVALLYILKFLRFGTVENQPRHFRMKYHVTECVNAFRKSD